MAVTTTPEDTHTPDPLVDEVLEALDRSLTKLKRRTRDVVNLGHERDELIATIENGGIAPVSDAVGTLDSEHSTAIHGESSAFDLSEETPNFDPGDIDPLEAREASPSWVADAEESAIEEGVDGEPEPIEDVASIDSSEELAATDDLVATDDSLAPEDPVATEDTLATEDLVAAEDVSATEILVAETAEVPDIPSEPAHESAAPSWESKAVPSWESSPVAQESPSWEENQTVDEAPGDADEASESPAATLEEAESDEADTSLDTEPSWETPDLEWSEDSPNDALDIAPHDFPHPTPPVDADAVTPVVDVEMAIEDEGREDDFSAPTDSAPSYLDQDDRVEEDDTSDDSPFAAEFEEHVEELGGSLQPSPFDLDTPPEPASYRPRSLQDEGDTDSLAAADLLREESQDEPTEQPTEHVAAAWNDLAGSQDEEPAPAASKTGSRLRDLVAQAQQAELDRANATPNEFDLVKDEPSLSRYDKHSAKLPTVGISSEELSSSVASLRNSFIEKSGSGRKPPSRDRSEAKPSRGDRKAEKRAAKEAAKAEKAAAKRERK